MDLVLERPAGSIAAIEVKAGTGVGASDVAALKSLRDQLGSQFQAGVVFYMVRQR